MTDDERKKLWAEIQEKAPVMAQLMRDAKRLGITFTLMKATVSEPSK